MLKAFFLREDKSRLLGEVTDKSDLFGNMLLPRLQCFLSASTLS